MQVISRYKRRNRRNAARILEKEKEKEEFEEERKKSEAGLEISGGRD